MTKVGNTDGCIFSMILERYITASFWGDDVVLSPPHPDAPGSSAATLSVVAGDGSATVEPHVKAALRVMSHIATAVGWGQQMTVEKLPMEQDEEAKYTITIKKREMTSSADNNI